MKSYPRLASKLFRSPLLIEEGARRGLEVALLSRSGPEAVEAMEPDRRERPAHMERGDLGESEGVSDDWVYYHRTARRTQEFLRVDDLYSKKRNVATIRIEGVIDKHLSQTEMMCFGGCDLADVERAIASAEADKSVQYVVLHIISPGGSVTGTPEMAWRVAELTKTKEVHAFIDCQACSAAYWIASQCDFIFANPSAMVGSVGVYMALVDETRALEMEGYAVNLIKSGTMKAMGASFKKLTDEERSYFQAQCTAIHNDFKLAVTLDRKISDEHLQGQSFSAIEAVKIGMVDELTDFSIDEHESWLLLGKPKR